MRENPVQFAVVREDPLIEIEVLERHHCQTPLLVASGGCTAMSLRAHLPSLAITLLDPNMAQLELVQRKIEAIAMLDRGERLALFNVENRDPAGLSECGNFESLFRQFRNFLFEFVLSSDDMLRLFCEPGALAHAPETLFKHKYWPVAFELFFSDAMLLAMFGPNAVQHAEAGSYPSYFRGVLERGLQRQDAFDNPFLHHVFLGHYLDRPGCLPHFLVEPAERYLFELHHGHIDEKVDLGDFDFVGLSNIMDWMAPEAIDALLEKVLAETNPGTVVMWRQLNNNRDLAVQLRGEFAFDDAWNQALLNRDRSLFYSGLHVGVRGG